MATWKKVSVVALVDVICLIPVFAQMGCAQASSEPAVVPPTGEELTDTELFAVFGKMRLDQEDGAPIVPIIGAGESKS